MSHGFEIENEFWGNTYSNDMTASIYLYIYGALKIWSLCNIVHSSAREQEEHT